MLCDITCCRIFSNQFHSPILCKRDYTLFLYKDVVVSAQAEYSYFSVDFRLKIFLYYSQIIAYDIFLLEFIGVSITSVWYLDLYIALFYCVTLCTCSIAFHCGQRGQEDDVTSNYTWLF